MKYSMVLLLAACVTPLLYAQNDPPLPPPPAPGQPAAAVLSSGLRNVHLANPGVPGAPPPPVAIVDRHAESGSEPKLLTLDFKGGSPKALAQAISKSMNTHLNVLVTEENNSVIIPPIKVEHAALNDFFEALKRSSMTTVSTNGSLYETWYGFEPEGSGEHAVWYFRVNRPRIAESPNVCRYYQLEPYLKKLPVESILSAINTGFEMLNITNPPQMKFHPETKLLIVVGRSEYQKVVESALDQLQLQGRPMPPKPTPTLAPLRSMR